MYLSEVKQMKLHQVSALFMFALVSLPANAATIFWEPTNEDVNFIYTTVSGYSLSIFDVDDFDTAQTNPLMLNTATGSDTVAIVPSGTDFDATSTVTGNSTTLFNDDQFVLAISDGANWFEPLSWFETAAGSNIYEVTFSNGIVTSIDAVPTIVPVPAAAWLFGSGLLGLIGLSRHRKRGPFQDCSVTKYFSR
jgi:hypothetical protein